MWLLGDDDERAGQVIEEIQGGGHLCEAFTSVATLSDQLAESPPKSIVVLRDSAGDEARRLGEATLVVDPARWPLIVQCADLGDPPVEPGADVLLVGEAVQHGLLQVLGFQAEERPGRDPLEALFAEHSLLGKPREEAVRELTAELHRTAAADLAAVFVEHGESTVVECSDFVLTDEQRAGMTKWARRAATAGAVVLLPTGEESSCRFITLVAAPLVSADGTELGLLCLIWAGWHEQSLRRQVLLRSAARRLGKELHWCETQDRLVDEVDRLQELGGLEPALGVWSRATLLRLADMKAAAGARQTDPLSVVVIRVAGMERIVETFGHSTGDDVLRHVAEVILYVVRVYDSIGRLGVDELAILFEGADADGARCAVGRIQRLLESQPFVTDSGLEHWVAITAGITEVTKREDGQQALARATFAARQARPSSDPVVVEAQPGRPPSTMPAPPSLEGKTLGGNYRLLRRIGTGGGGGVYRGEDLGLRRPVAVKVLLPHFAGDQALVEQFRQEATILASLRHPNLVNVYSFGLHKRHAYFVMELVEGESVRGTIDRRIRDGNPMPLARVRLVVEQLASALDTLHRSGVVHRDVKPDNLLVDPFRQRTVLVDVGIARRRGADVCVAGTPGYMAPEVFTVADPGQAVDVFGFAVTLYEMLTLRRPWALPEDLAAMAQHQHDTPPERPSDIRPALAPVDEVLLKALAFEPGERWQSARELAEAFLGALAFVDELADERSPESAVASSQGAAISHPLLGELAAHDGAEPLSRGVVFRSVARVFGLRPAAQWRGELAARDPQLGAVLGPALPPLDWAPTAALVRVLQADTPDGRNADSFARDLGRATVRATFRRFFPASITTLAPRGTLQALHEIWPHYHSWGTLEVVADTDREAVVCLTGSPPEPMLTALIAGMLEQLVVLSGGREVTVRETGGATTDEGCCQFEIAWEWTPRSLVPLSQS
ncbi:MAG: protein kinase [Deltaproteobacteria bacterium]|nr:protein kinase [Deltaproteobacteria bacterium]